MSLGSLVPVVPISLYAKPSPLRDVLTYYKPGRETFRPQFGVLLADLVDRFLRIHGDDLSMHLGGWSDIVVVPSTHRTGAHPLEPVLSTAGVSTARGYVRSTGVRGKHRSFGRPLFTADSGKVIGRRILLVEDVYVTGARSQSCAQALVAAGADVAGLLVLGRRVNPDHDRLSQLFWESQSIGARPLEESHEWLRSGR